MSNFIDRVLAAYRPLYLRGLLMDGQYRLPARQEKAKPEKGNRVVQLTPAFDPGRKRVLVMPAAAGVSLRMRSKDEPSGGLSGA
ncbi:hypothetical protein [Dyella nitratireducens]|uniref:Transposase n=1 Tax=Dyella nitratireducens TaxID=1849580 RepID=A0ABQ1FVT0_9GAMM|nr:hypothetical protein [Dyella nitratireducens]GGA31125.1 hypothetical protein GCM10010981_20220 [Dyella nitratireducens]GLQ42915.1 hypothetical protein GCM10007902_27650 [Dyella nitratireducens]